MKAAASELDGCSAAAAEPEVLEVTSAAPPLTVGVEDGLLVVVDAAVDNADAGMVESPLTRIGPLEVGGVVAEVPAAVFDVEPDAEVDAEPDTEVEIEAVSET